MEGKWTSVFCDVDCILRPKCFVFRCCNDSMQWRYNTWQTLVNTAFGGRIPKLWEFLLERGSVLMLAEAKATPYVGFYEIVDSHGRERPVIVLMMTFDTVNNSASVDLLCSDPGFSRENPVLCGRLLLQCVQTIDHIFMRLAPIYGYTMIIGRRKRFEKVIGRISGKWRAYWPNFMLMEEKPGRRCGVHVFDKNYE